MTTKANEVRVYNGGRTVEPEIKRLMEHFGECSPGDTLPYKDLVEIIQAPYASSRFTTVLGSFRKRLRKERNLETARYRGSDGLYVLQDQERVGDGFLNFRRDAKRARNTAVKIAMIPTERMNTRAREVVQHLRRQAEVQVVSYEGSVKALLPHFKQPGRLPQMRPGGELTT